jgi:hypothetical protein
MQVVKKPSLARSLARSLALSLSLSLSLSHTCAARSLGQATRRGHDKRGGAWPTDRNGSKGATGIKKHIIGCDDGGRQGVGSSGGGVEGFGW